MASTRTLIIALSLKFDVPSGLGQGQGAHGIICTKMDCLGFLLILTLLSCPEAYRPTHTPCPGQSQKSKNSAHRKGPVFTWHITGCVYLNLVPKIGVFQADVGLFQVEPDRNHSFTLDSQVGQPWVVKGQKLAAALS